MFNDIVSHPPDKHSIPIFKSISNSNKTHIEIKYRNADCNGLHYYKFKGKYYRVHTRSNGEIAIIY